jgi:hypothetical protein
MIGKGTRFILGTIFSANSDGKVQPLSVMKITNKMHYIDSFIIPSRLYIFRAMFSPIIRGT